MPENLKSCKMVRCFVLRAIINGTICNFNGKSANPVETDEYNRRTKTRIYSWSITVSDYTIKLSSQYLVQVILYTIITVCTFYR